MPNIDEQGRPIPDFHAGQLDSMLGFLDYQRATLEWKCRGVDASGLRATIPSSAMTLGGLLKHMALVEDIWFSKYLLDREYSAPWNSVDWDADHDWEWHTAADDSPDELFALWHAAIAQSRTNVADALARSGDLDQLAKRAWHDGRQPSLRWIIMHMIEEYARHNGHADLLRESIDGETGE